MTTYSRHQEFVNGLIHGLGIVFGVSCLPVLTSLATSHGNIRGVIGSGIYGFCFLLLFTVSTLYHLVSDVEIKRILKVFDYISIYFLIAGTYTPFLLVYLYNPFGITLLCVLWGLAVAGIFFKAMFPRRFEAASVAIYLAMGWIVVAGGRTFFETLPNDVLWLIFIGGVLYTVGVYFYLRDRHRYTHALWHGIVLAAAVCHYVAVLLAM